MRALVIYSFGLFCLIVASYLAAGAAFMIYDEFAGATSRAWWWVYLLNGAAPFLAGVPISAFFVKFLDSRGEFRPTLVGHLQRASTWYAFGAWVLLVMNSNRGNSDFGLWSQLIIWPLIATTGALITDLCWTWRKAIAVRVT